MKIQWEDIWLAQGAEGETVTWPSGLGTGSDFDVQEAKAIGAGTPRYFDRGNQKSNFRFTVLRRHDSVADAELFFLQHFGDLPRLGTLKFVVTRTDGGEVTRYLAGALLKPKEIVPIGVSTRASYQVFGGKVTNTAALPNGGLQPADDPGGIDSPWFTRPGDRPIRGAL